MWMRREVSDPEVLNLRLCEHIQIKIRDSQQHRSSLHVTSLLGARVVIIVFSGAAAKSLGGVGG